MKNLHPLRAAAAALLLSPWAFAAEPTPGAVELQWRVQPNEQIYGFNVYRSEERSGPFVRVNTDLVKAAADGAGGLQARFEDHPDSSAAVLYYYVDTVKQNGRSERLTGVLSKRR